ncbi:MAG: DUF2071 domain-containing protein [Chloroflexi bacterium]|nr:DUF2071 domain-containing protein [Chloroflexota bacterium]
MRREVETAPGSHATVIPLLVQGAKSPRTTDLPASLSELGRKENFPLDMRSFGDDLDRLMPRLQSLDPWCSFAPPERPPLMDGVFEDVLHLHWPVDPTSLLGHLPAGFEVDTYGGKAWISAECVGVATGWYRRTPRLLPAFRAAGRASERLGLQNFARMPTAWWRTHVSYRGRPGWLALYVASPNIVGAFLLRAYARTYPVNHRAFRFSRSGEDRSMQVAAKGSPSVRATYRPGGVAFIPRRDTLESFLYHRNLIHGGPPGSPLSSQVEIQFAPWSLRQAEALELKETFFKRFSLQPLDAPVAHTATRISAACWSAAPAGEQ